MATAYKQYDRYILVSASDIPLVKKDELKEKLQYKSNYIATWTVVERKSCLNSELYNEFFKYNNNDVLNYSECKGSRIKIYLSLFIRKLFHYYPFKFIGSFERYAKGSQWWCVSHSLCMDFLTAFENNIGDEFKRMHAPDEKFFHTIALNSRNNDSVVTLTNQHRAEVHGLHYINWPSSSHTNLEFSYHEIEHARKMGAQFARKINHNEITNFLQFINRNLLKS